jgi:hypothetical protein
MRWRILTLQLVFVTMPDQLVSQDSPGRLCYDQADHVVDRTAVAWAERFAPILRFADAETYYPTVPFFTALDGMQNDGTSPYQDFADVEEISPRGTVAGQVDWGRMHRWYAGKSIREPVSPGVVAEVIAPGDSLAAREDTSSKEAKDTQVTQYPKDTLRLPEIRKELRERQRRLNASAVGYRVCQLDEDESMAVWRYLRSDEQAWRRFRDLDLSSSELRRRTRFVVVEYHLYYLQDAGLKGHPNDTEGVFVLQMIDLNELADEQWKGMPVIVIGAGHSDLTPNNVLVLVPNDVITLEWVRDFPLTTPPDTSSESLVSDRHLNVLVELGGHSSAPDIEPYGSFTAGVDVNWHLDDIWGTRDVQAVAGTGFHGPFIYDMEFPRSPSAPVAVPSSVDCRVYESMQRDCAQYALVALNDLEYLLESAADTLVSNNEFRDFVNGRIKRQFVRPPSAKPLLPRDSFPVFKGFSDNASGATISAARAAFARWREGFSMRGKPFLPGKYLPWRGSKATTLISDQFKLRLFRPAARGISTFWDALRLVNYGVRYEAGDRLEPYLGIILPAIASEFLPMRLPGFLELQVGSYRSLDDASNPNVLALGMVWEHRYVGNTMISPYQRVSWIPYRERALGDTTAANGSLAAGVSFVWPVKKHKTPFDLVNAIRLRTGLRIDLGHWDNLFRDAGFEFSISFRQ